MERWKIGADSWGILRLEGQNDDEYKQDRRFEDNNDVPSAFTQRWIDEECQQKDCRKEIEEVVV